MLNDARLIGRAKLTRGRSTVLKTLLSPHRHSASSNISGLLSAQHLKPLKARNSNSIRLIDLMTQQETSGSGSDFDEPISTSAILHTTTKHNSGEHGQVNSNLYLITHLLLFLLLLELKLEFLLLLEETIFN